MRYAVKKSQDGVFYEIRVLVDDSTLLENEQEISAEEAVSIPIPCKLVDGEYVPAMPPENLNTIVIVEIPSEQREKAYNTDAIIEWDGKIITVTQAAQLWQYYAAEGNDKAVQLTTLISKAKQTIREMYPD